MKAKGQYAENFTLLHQHRAGICLPSVTEVAAAEKVQVGKMLGNEFKLLTQLIPDFWWTINV
jgi:hypothetical protein